MAPIESEEISGGTPEDTTAELNELRRKADAFDRVDRERNHAFKLLRKLEAKIEQDEEAKQNSDFGMDSADQATRRLYGEIKSLRDQVGSLLERQVASPEDEALEPYLERARNDAPELMSIKDPIRRVEAYRRLARAYRVEDNNKADDGRSRKSDAAYRAQLTQGGSGGNTRSRDEDRELADFQKKMRAAKTQVERDSLADSWADKHSDRRL